MDRMIQLHLDVENEKPEATNLPNQERKEPEAAITDQRVNQILKRAAHKAGTEFRRSGSGIFSK